MSAPKTVYVWAWTVRYAGDVVMSYFRMDYDQAVRENASEARHVPVSRLVRVALPVPGKTRRKKT
jgi:hypothetical protein